MSDWIQNPDLNRLVQELNDVLPSHSDGEGESAAEIDPAAGPAGAAGSLVAMPARLGGRLEARGELAELLALVAAKGASDLLLVAGRAPMLRVDGALHKLSWGSVSGETLRTLFEDHFDERLRRCLAETGSADFSVKLPDPQGGLSPWRFRANLHRQRGELAAAIRALPREIPSLADLNLPPELAQLVRPGHGLLLLCGPTGAGKSSTLAALVREIYRQRVCHIVTIEDPVEYDHVTDRGVVEHVEVGRDAPSFAQALRAALRQDPDVLLVGEMRDLPTIQAAMTAAETGHLVLSTLHSGSAPRAVHRVIDVFPAQQQTQVRVQLAQALRAVVVQTLLPRSEGVGRLPAVEVLQATYAVRQLIRTQHPEKLYNEITLGRRQGMITLEASLAEWVRKGKVDREEALLRANHPQELESLLSRD